MKLDNIFVEFLPNRCYCPLWTMPTPKSRYPKIAIPGFGSKSAHRVAMLILLGSAPFMNHRCGNKLCRNPFHIYGGTDKQNRRDTKLHESSAAYRKAMEFNKRDVFGGVWMPEAPVLSTEASLLPEFENFSDECRRADWLFPTYDGYLQLEETDRSGQQVGVHRVLYHLYKGPIDKYDIVTHTCGDKHCVNIRHLKVTDRADPSSLDYERKVDRRVKTGDAEWSLITDFSIPVDEVATLTGLHRQTVVVRRTEIRRSLGLLKSRKLS